MTKRAMYRHCARVGIEFTTPFLVGGGEEDPLFDSAPVLDPFGVPCIPGTTLAGLLRHAYEKKPHRNKELTDALFGFSPENKRGEGQGSRLWVSFGRIHNSRNLPMDGSVDSQRLQADPLLASSMAPTVRDHVRIDFRGVAAFRGKFDQMALQAGHRFTFDLMVEGDHSHAEDLDELLNLLQSGEIRIGASQRSGFGAFKVIECRKASYDLSTEQGWNSFSSWPVRLDRPLPAHAEIHQAPEPKSKQTFASLSVELRAEGFWGINSVEEWLLPEEDNDPDLSKPPDMNPFRDERIIWHNNQGSLTDPVLVVPASAVKGALAHRVAFHHNAGQKVFADNAEEVDGEFDTWLEGHCGSNNKAVNQLFGEPSDEKEDKGRAGRVIIDDIWLDEVQSGDMVRVMHNSIDRFTGGTRMGALFEERVIHGKGFRLDLKLLEPDQIDNEAKSALAKALRDLLEGRLQLGAGSGRGNGYFQGIDEANQAMERFEKEMGL